MIIFVKGNNSAEMNKNLIDDIHNPMRE